MRTLVMRAIVVVAAGAAVLAGNATAAADDPPTQTETYTIGPFDLAPQGEIGDQVNRLFEEVARPAGDVWVRSIDWAVVDGQGNPIADHDAHLHHIVLLDSARPDYLCSFPGQSRFSGAGKELTPFALPAPYAYYAPDSTWTGVYHVMNLSPAPLRASIEYTVTWTPVGEGDFLDVEPYFLDVTGCWGNSEYTVPGDGGPGSIHEKSRTYTIDRDGIAVVGGGHIHAGGMDLILTHEGTEVCRAVAVYQSGGGGGHHSLQTVTPCGQVDHAWSTGDELDLVSRYHNNQPVSGAMGIMVMYVHHTGPPPPPPTIEIVDVDLVHGELTGTLLCNRAMEAWVDGQIVQPKKPEPISAYGYTEEQVQCGADPTPFSVTLMDGNGVLTGGSAAYQVYASASTGRDYVFTEAEGALHLTGRHDLSGPTIEPHGPFEFVLDTAMSATDPVLVGSIECPEAAVVHLDANLRQRVGRNMVFAYASDSVFCDGVTRFELPVWGGGGRLAGGPVAVTLYAWSFDGSVPTSGSAVGTVQVIGATPPGSGGYTIPDPDPDSPLQVISAARHDDGVVVQVGYDECPTGVQYYVDVVASTDGQGQGRRLEPPRAYGFGYGTCDGGSEFSALIDSDVANRLVLEVYFNWYDEVTGNWGWETNTARIRLRGH